MNTVTDYTAERLDQGKIECEFAVGDLKKALKTSTPVEALLILPLIERAATLARDIEALKNAREVKL